MVAKLHHVIIQYPCEITYLIQFNSIIFGLERLWAMESPNKLNITSCRLFDSLLRIFLHHLTFNHIQASLQWTLFSNNLHCGKTMSCVNFWDMRYRSMRPAEHPSITARKLNIRLHGCIRIKDIKYKVYVNKKPKCSRWNMGWNSGVEMLSTINVN